MKLEKIIVTRHKALADYFIEMGYAEQGTPVFCFVKESEVIGRHVLGILPYDMACLTAKFTTVDLRISKEDRGRELSLNEMIPCIKKVSTYKITEVKDD